MKTVLFISHDATCTGAPIVLLNFLKWLKANTKISFVILLKDGGMLEPEFAALAPTWVFNQRTSTGKKFSERVLRYLDRNSRTRSLYRQILKQQLSRYSIDLIYSNTVSNVEVLEFLRTFKTRQNCPVISHVHELQWAIESYIGSENFSRTQAYTTQYIAVSKAVEKNLIENHGISSQKIKLIYECIPLASPVLTPAQLDQKRAEVRQQFGIPKEAHLICAAGQIDWRKGADLFVQLAATLDRYSDRYHADDPPLFFLWLGQAVQQEFLAQLLHEVHKLNLETIVQFVGLKPNPLDYFAACDLFVLMSREDPFPLVCLEAALMAKPIVCFDQAGGIPELVETDAGLVIPYLDIETMAVRILDLLQSPTLCQQMGLQARQKVQDLYNLDIIAPILLQVIENHLFAEDSPSVG
jgi:glycosyltransferase involved in cell wall biosynthesis